MVDFRTVTSGERERVALRNTVKFPPSTTAAPGVQASCCFKSNCRYKEYTTSCTSCFEHEAKLGDERISQFNSIASPPLYLSPPLPLTVMSTDNGGNLCAEFCASFCGMHLPSCQFLLTSFATVQPSVHFPHLRTGAI